MDHLKVPFHASVRGTLGEFLRNLTSRGTYCAINDNCNNAGKAPWTTLQLVLVERTAHDDLVLAAAVQSL